MSFYSLIEKYRGFNVDGFFEAVTASKIETILASESLSELDFLALLSKPADAYLERMAQKAHHLTCKHFGKAVSLYTPIYISNYCDNTCAYCSFANQHKILRQKLSLEQIEVEAKTIAASGIRNILLLTGEAPSIAGFSYIRDAVEVLKRYFSSISIEVFPMTKQQYAELIKSGVDYLVIYQETYCESLYSKLHTCGPKTDFRWRLDAAERALQASMRGVTLGVLLGLNNYKIDAFYLALHAKYLQRHFPEAEITVSFPRIRPLVSEFKIEHPLSDRQFVQLIVAFRLFFPTAGISLTTRESVPMRNNLIPLGITKMSAGVSTAVGGHTEVNTHGQFEIADTRSVEQVKEALSEKGYQAVMHDWDHRLSIRTYG